MRAPRRTRRPCTASSSGSTSRVCPPAQGPPPARRSRPPTTRSWAPPTPTRGSCWRSGSETRSASRWIASTGTSTSPTWVRSCTRKWTSWTLDGAIWYCRQFDSGYNTNSGQIRRILGPTEPAAVPGQRPALNALSPAYPLPSRDRVHLAFTLGHAARVELSILDLAGRRLRRIVISRDAGTYVQEWDGLDDSGRAADSGLYFARLGVEGELYERRIVLVR